MKARDRDLIDQLVTEMKPRKRLLPPAVRAGMWMLASATYTVVVLWIVDVRKDVSRVLADPHSVIEASSLVAAACFAALAAFHRVIPGRARGATLSTAAASAACVVWILSLGSRWTDADGGAGWRCVANLAVFGLGPALACAAMLARARSIDVPSAVMTWFPAGALAMFATQLACSKDGVQHVIIWHAVPVVAGLGLAISLAPSIVQAWQQQRSSF